MINNIIKSTVDKFGQRSKKKRYEKLVAEYSQDLYRYAYWLCHHPHDAEDLVQETYLRAWRFLDNLKDDELAKPWLITILRRENARRFRGQPVEHVNIEDCDFLYHDERPDLDATLRAKIIALPDIYREPLLLQIVMGFTADEISKITALNLNTVLTRLSRGKKQLFDNDTDTNDLRTRYGA